MGTIVERTLKSGTLARYAVYRVDDRQKWERVPPEYEGKRGAARFLAERAAAVHPTGRATLAEFAAHWLELKKQQVKKTSWQTYDVGLRLYAIPALGHRKLDQIRPQELQEFVTGVCQHISVRHCQNAVLLLLRQMFDLAEQYGLVLRNPAASGSRSRSTPTGICFRSSGIPPAPSGWGTPRIWACR